MKFASPETGFRVKIKNMKKSKKPVDKTVLHIITNALREIPKCIRI